MIIKKIKVLGVWVHIHKPHPTKLEEIDCWSTHNNLKQVVKDLTSYRNKLL